MSSSLDPLFVCVNLSLTVASRLLASQPVIAELDTEYISACYRCWDTYQRGEASAVKRLEREEDERLSWLEDGVDRTLEDREYRSAIRFRECDDSEQLARDFHGQSRSIWPLSTWVRRLH